MHDLYTVVCMQHGRFPLRAAHHFLIEFYCDLLALQLQTHDQFRKRRMLFYFLGFAVDVNAQD